MSEENKQPLQPVFAGFWQRILAFSVDMMLLVALGAVVGLSFSDFFARVWPWSQLVGLFSILLYFGLGNSRVFKGQTLGKRLLKIRVVGCDGQPIRLPLSLLRIFILVLPSYGGAFYLPPMNEMGILFKIYTGSLVALLFVLIYFFIFNKKTRRSLHDIIAKSSVVSTKVSLPDQTIPKPWRGHFIIASVLIFVWLVGAYFFTRVMTQSFDLDRLTLIQSELVAYQDIHYANVFSGKILNQDIKYLRVQARWKGTPESNSIAANEIAKIVRKHISSEQGYSALKVIIITGVDVGTFEYNKQYLEQFIIY
jgi:uncharacterized RDD family membrane protein YckC